MGARQAKEPAKVAKRTIEPVEKVSSNANRVANRAIDPENREQQLIGLAVNLAEEKLRDGTAPTQIITHYLKLATQREKIELENLRKQAAMIDAKTSSMTKSQEDENLAKEAIEAMRSYKPSE